MAQGKEDFAFSKARWTFEAGSGDLEATCWGSGDVEIADAPERGEDIRILMLVFGVPAILVGLGVIAMCIWLIFFTQRRPEPNPRVGEATAWAPRTDDRRGGDAGGRSCSNERWKE